MNYLLPLYLILGILPSLAWLFYYLRKDPHPEPNMMILRAFFYGSLVTIPVFFLQLGLSWLMTHILPSAIVDSSPLLFSAIKWLFIIALTEEISKYIIVRLVIFKSTELDEPVDMMVYMVVVALGFAAVENILYVFASVYGLDGILPFDSVIAAVAAVLIVRFIGATFLHTLCSAMVGYFAAMASLYNKKRVLLVLVGLFLAIILHGIYDFSLITLPYPFNVVIPVIIILILALFMLYDFNDIKKIKSICRL